MYALVAALILSVTPLPAQPSPAHLPTVIQGAVIEHTLRDYIASVQAVEVSAYVDAVVADEARAEVARQEALRAAQTAPVALSTTSTMRSGPGHSDAWWHGVAICEQGGRNDPYFGYFSIMDGSAGGLDWSTQVTIANGIISRYGDSAWAASCVAAGYSASPSG